MKGKEELDGLVVVVSSSFKVQIPAFRVLGDQARPKVSNGRAWISEAENARVTWMVMRAWWVAAGSPHGPLSNVSALVG